MSCSGCLVRPLENADKLLRLPLFIKDQSRGQALLKSLRSQRWDVANRVACKTKPNHSRNTTASCILVCKIRARYKRALLGLYVSRRKA